MIYTSKLFQHWSSSKSSNTKYTIHYFSKYMFAEMLKDLAGLNKTLLPSTMSYFTRHDFTEEIFVTDQCVLDNEFSVNLSCWMLCRRFHIQRVSLQCGFGHGSPNVDVDKRTLDTVGIGIFADLCSLKKSNNNVTTFFIANLFDLKDLIQVDRISF